MNPRDRREPPDLDPEIRRLEARLALPEAREAIQLARALPTREYGALYRTLAHAFQTARDAGVLDPIEADERIAFMLEHAAEEGAEAIYDAFAGRFEESRVAHDLADGEYWPAGEGPEDYERLNDEFGEACRQHLIASIRRFGRPDLATLCESDHHRWNALVERGRKHWHPD